MRKFAVLIILFCFNLIGFSQINYSGQVLDNDTNEPIEFANIFNKENYTITNEDGKFDFNSNLDSISIKFLGYETLKTTVNNLPKNGIIHLKSKTFELDEVIVTNGKSIFKKMVKTIKDITPESYNEEFFLRTVLKKNDSLLKIQDINGVVNRKVLFATEANPMPKKNYTVYLNNMRKAGYKEKNIYFKLLNFNQLLTELVKVSISLDAVTVNKKEIKDTDLLLLEIEPKSEDDNFKKGHYIINSKDKSLHNVFWAFEMQGKYKKKGPLKYRTIKSGLNVNFYRSKENNQYRIKNAKKNYTVECYYKEDEKIIYDVTYIYKTKEFTENIIKSNQVSTKKDIFKLKHPYDEVYWDNNPHLKLTDEMSDFIKILEESDLETVTNFKK